jgi:hypothetical protein
VKNPYSKNYVDLVPIIDEDNSWEFDKCNRVIIVVKNTGFLNSLAIKYFGKPENKEIELDRYGSFVWQRIDGIKTIQDIIDDVVETFEEERILTTKRTVMFFEMLRINRLIWYKKINVI